MALTWQQFCKAPIRSLPRSALVLPLTVSLLLHAGVVVAVVVFRLGLRERPARLTDSTAETALVLPPAPAPATPPTPATPAPSAPATTPEPQPEPEPPTVVVVPTPVTIEVVPTLRPTAEPAAPAAAPTPAIGPVMPVMPSTPPSPAMLDAGPLPVSFAGVEGSRAERVVYVVDASGAMTSTLKFVKEELARSIARLGPSQSFQIVVVHGAVDDESQAEVAAFPSGDLVEAGGDARLRAAAWLEGVQPAGRSDPLAGLTAALHQDPELVFLLTRSIKRSGTNAEWGQGVRATLDALEELNAPNPRTGQRPAVIKAIQFVDDDPTGLLEAIGRVHGDGPGSYRVLKVEELK